MAGRPRRATGRARLAVLGERTGHPGQLYAWGITAYGLGSPVTAVAIVRRPVPSSPMRLAMVSWVGQGLAFVVM